MAVFVFSNRKPLFKQNEDISPCLCDEILKKTFGATLAALARGFYDCHFEQGEGTGDEVGFEVEGVYFITRPCSRTVLCITI